MSTDWERNLFSEGQYTYIRDMKALAKSAPPIGHAPLPAYMSRIVTTLRVEAWEKLLRPMPDRECAEYVLDGLQDGFRIGFDGRSPHASARRNMLSAERNPEVVEKYLAKEKALGRVVVVQPRDCASIHINRFGVIPKRYQPGKWRLIVDLSHP